MIYVFNYVKNKKPKSKKKKLIHFQVKNYFKKHHTNQTTNGYLFFI